LARLPLVVAAVLTLGLSSGGQAALPDSASVRRVIDGDTIELTDGRLIRYLGVDAPELRRRVGEEWIVDPEPGAQAAAEANRRWVEGRTVRLEYDVATHDRFGRLLAYVYVESGRDIVAAAGEPPADDRGAGEVMVNAELLRAGYAQPLTIPPNVRYAERFRALTREAQAAGRGVWAKP
jgi:micrococcal nuclease